MGLCEFTSANYFGFFGGDDAGAAAGEGVGDGPGGCYLGDGGVGGGRKYFFDFVPRPAEAFFMEPCAIVVVGVVFSGGDFFGGECKRNSRWTLNRIAASRAWSQSSTAAYLEELGTARLRCSASSLLGFSRTNHMAASAKSRLPDRPT